MAILSSEELAYFSIFKQQNMTNLSLLSACVMRTQVEEELCLSKKSYVEVGLQPQRYS